MTFCSMATFVFLEDKPLAPPGSLREQAVAHWRRLHSDEGSQFNEVVEIDAATIPQLVTWGTSPENVIPIDGTAPYPKSVEEASRQEAVRKSLAYIAPSPGMIVAGVPIEHVSIGSCTNCRIEGLREAAAVAPGGHVAASVRHALVVPGSGRVKRQAKAKGLDQIFIHASFEWREPGCSICLAMNYDQVHAGERCASPSNRNFVGRHGAVARTHLLSPAMAALAAPTGRLSDICSFADQPRLESM